MILVDVYVPAVDRIYDFWLDETKTVSAAAAEIAAMICQKEQWQLTGEAADLSLWHSGQKRLADNLTLADNGIHAGARLMLI